MNASVLYTYSFVYLRFVHKTHAQHNWVSFKHKEKREAQLRWSLSVPERTAENVNDAWTASRLVFFRLYFENIL